MNPSEKKLSDQRLRRAATQALESLERAGVSSLPRPRKGAKPTVAADDAAGAASTTITAKKSPSPKSTPAPALPQSSPAVAAPPIAAGGKLAQLDVLRAEVAACTLCAELASTRTQTVFGVGDPNARLCFFGEAPGADEDRLGEPFVGRAGQLLDKIIEACGMRRQDVYICNVLRCRPPGNRTPAADEVANCRQHFQRQLAIVRPEFVCCLGTVAAQALLDTTETIGRLRKKFFDRDGMRIICTYHPAYLLRNPAAKRDVWDDMKLLMAEMGVTL
ncbi:MAG TPA: uracil-DNA glycosylase [Pirellulales bacterium]|nr:uracil-DNA glycosylase [Pirellulales bacterium]